jgi:putative heme-binding domain-containing protein
MKFGSFRCRAGFATLILLLPGWFALAQQRDPNVASTPPLTPEQERKSFHVPAGFEVQLVAAEPNVRKPININFDDRGRLWVTESVEYPFPAKDKAPKRDTIRILEDKNNDGLAGEVKTFTDGLNIPIGVLPVTGGAIVYSIPSIWRYYDSKGTDRADRHEELYSKYGFNDTHGMTGEFTWGFDGWVYACHGFSNTSTVAGKDKAAITMQSGNVYRFRTDGSHCEQITWGQVNPFGLCFDPLGNLYSCDCHSRPIYQLLRGAYYPSFGKPHDGLGYGPEMMTHDHGSTAIAGITYYAADHFPEAYRDTIFVGNVVTNRINHDKLEKHGSTYRAIQQKDFLSSDDPWFRPVDIKLGPDGALYVADFYNRIIGHYEVPLTHPGRDRERGRIWRIVYKGADGKGANPTRPRADWAKASVAELVEDMGHANLTVRFKAMNQLVERGGDAGADAVKKAMSDKNAFRRMHGLWVLDRTGKLDDDTLNTAAKDGDRGVRVHAFKVLAERSKLSDAQRQLAVDALKDGDAFVQRAAAAALGRHPAPSNIWPLLELRHKAPADDTHLVHVVRMSLRDQLRPAGTWNAVRAGMWSEADQRALADVATGVPSPEAGSFLVHHLAKSKEHDGNQVRYANHAARFAPNSDADELLKWMRGTNGNLPHKVALFKAFQQGTQARGAQLNDAARDWAEDLVEKALVSPHEGEVLSGIELSGSLRLARMAKPLSEKATNAKASEGQRAAALTALVTIDAKKHVPVLTSVLTDASAPIGLREKSANLLGGVNQPESHEALLKSLASAPGRLGTTIAVALASSKPGAEKLLEAVTAGKASPRLLLERQVDVRLQNAGVPNLKERVAKLTQGLPPADQKLQQLLKSRLEGFGKAKSDATRGALLFEKNCANCHQIANKGAKIGPQLDGIGIRGAERIIEDILDPNRNVDQAFRSTTLNLKNGQVVTGLLLREEGAVLVMADAQGKEVRVTKDQVEERIVSPLSPMPANFMEQLPEEDFYHLLAYLLTQRVAPEKK